MAYANNDKAQAYKAITAPIANIMSLTEEQKSNIIGNAISFLKACPADTLIHDYGMAGKCYAWEELQRVKTFKKNHNIK